jgi:hypothetical protein
MKRRGSLGFKVSAGMFTLGLVAAGCVARERDFGASSTGMGGGTSSSSSGAGGAMSSSSASATSSSGSSGSSGSGMGPGCTGAIDMMIVNDMAFLMTAQACGQMCLGDANKSACAASCMEMNTKLSTACSLCWGDYIACVIDHCLSQCLQLTSQQCQDCTAMYCAPAYQACSGL